MEVAVGLDVDLDRLRAGGCERFQVEVWAREHQVDMPEDVVIMDDGSAILLYNITDISLKE